MSMRTAARALAGALLALLPLAGCEREAESAAPGAQASAAQPWEGISPDSLYGATPEENLRVPRVELDALGIPAGWDGMRVAAISDLQLGLWEDNEQVAAAAVRRAVELKPDLIVLLGDYLAQGADTAALARVLAPLRGRRALAVLGDRDIRSDSLGAAITRTLRGQGVQVLSNASVPIVFGGDTAMISGVDPDLATMPVGDQKWVLGTLGSGRLGLLLAHNPLLAAQAPEGRFPAVLAGGTVCGRVEVPGTPRLSWLQGEGLPGAVVPQVPRLFRLGDTVMFVTCGVGYGFAPARYGGVPEVALITLRPVGAEQPVEAAAADSVSLDTLIDRYQRRDTATAEGESTTG
jgi:predicted MPP superfamily phosphohydrolase